MLQSRSLTLLFEPESGQYFILDESSKLPVVSITFNRVIPIEEEDLTYLAANFMGRLAEDLYTHKVLNDAFAKFGADA